MHDGCSARAWVQVAGRRHGARRRASSSRGSTPSPTSRPASSRRVTGPASMDLAASDRAIATERPEVFEPLADITLFKRHDRMEFYTWGAEDCCLPEGATRATLDGKIATLAVGDVLILEEVVGPTTGEPADADPGHRHAVRLTEVSTGTDPLGGAGITRIAMGQGRRAPVPAVRVGDRDRRARRGDRGHDRRGVGQHRARRPWADGRRRPSRGGAAVDARALPPAGRPMRHRRRGPDRAAVRADPPALARVAHAALRRVGGGSRGAPLGRAGGVAPGRARHGVRDAVGGPRRPPGVDADRTRLRRRGRGGRRGAAPLRRRPSRRPADRRHDVQRDVPDRQRDRRQRRRRGDRARCERHARDRRRSQPAAGDRAASIPSPSRRSAASHRSRSGRRNVR